MSEGRRHAACSFQCSIPASMSAQLFKLDVSTSSDLSSAHLECFELVARIESSNNDNEVIKVRCERRRRELCMCVRCVSEVTLPENGQRVSE